MHRCWALAQAQPGKGGAGGQRAQRSAAAAWGAARRAGAARRVRCHADRLRKVGRLHLEGGLHPAAHNLHQAAAEHLDAMTAQGAR